MHEQMVLFVFAIAKGDFPSGLIILRNNMNSPLYYLLCRKIILFTMMLFLVNIVNSIKDQQSAMFLKRVLLENKLFKDVLCHIWIYLM